MHFVRLALVALLALSLTACLSMKTYPDPQFHGATIESIGKFNSVTKIRLEVIFQRNGKDFPRAVKQVRSLVEKALQTSGAFELSTDASAPVLRVTFNNVADMADAAKKGFATGLTLGGKGSTVADYYEATIQFGTGDSAVTKGYKHALHTTIGNADAPIEGVVAMAPAAAFGVVVDDIMLNFIKDLKDDGKISQRTINFNTYVAAR
jgi:hypothetical protein